MKIYNYLKNGFPKPEAGSSKVFISHRTLSLTVVRSSCLKQPKKNGTSVTILSCFFPTELSLFHKTDIIFNETANIPQQKGLLSKVLNSITDWSAVTDENVLKFHYINFVVF